MSVSFQFSRKLLKYKKCPSHQFLSRPKHVFIGVWVSHWIYRWRHQRQKEETISSTKSADKETELKHRIPYGLRKRSAHQVKKTE